MTDNLLTLALKVELTTEPNRELDAEVACSLRLGEYTHRNERGSIEDHGYPAMIPERDHWADWRKRGNYNFHSRSGTSMREAPRYTADDASRIKAAAALRAKAAFDQVAA
jgi:hypothetical protein